MSTSGELIVVPNKTKEVFSSSQSSLSQLSNLRKNTTFGLSKLSGYLEKRGVGKLGKAWKKRFFELEDGKLNYYILSNDIKKLKGQIEIQTITNIQPKEDQLEEGWRFLIDTAKRRYDLRTLDGEHVMWYWIEGIKYVQTKLVTKKLRDQISTRRKSVTQLELERKREENNLIISELKSHIQTLKNRINELQEEKKNQITTLKRELLLTKQQVSSPDLKTLQASTLSFSSSSSTLPDSSFIESNNQLSISPESEWLEIIKFSNLEIERLNGIIQKQELEMNEMKKRTEFLEKELLLHQTRQHTEIQLLTQKLESEVRSKEVLLQNNKELEEQIRLLRIQNPQEKIDQSSVAHQLAIRLENFWEPDFSKTICTLCNQSFTWLKRKHHCRLCGKIFCGECSSFIFVVEHNFLTHRLRICKTCFESGNLNNFPFLV